MKVGMRMIFLNFLFNFKPVAFSEPLLFLLVWDGVDL